VDVVGIGDRKEDKEKKEREKRRQRRKIGGKKEKWNKRKLSKLIVGQSGKGK
jgi:hypothetical protein